LALDDEIKGFIKTIKWPFCENYNKIMKGEIKKLIV
jgi:hypothetical protein